MKYPDTGLVLLAAGASRRLGQPKQLLEFQGKTLLQRVIDLADELEFGVQILVLGANADAIERNIDPRGFLIARNEVWEEGIASSIRVGLASARKSRVKHLLFLLSDQPRLSAEFLQELLRTHLDRGSMATYSEYEGQIGVPAVFSEGLFPQLETLKGDQGARKLAYLNRLKFFTVPFEGGIFDIDTPEDVERLRLIEHKRMKVTVKYFGLLAEAAGKAEETRELSSGIKAGELKDRCLEELDLPNPESVQVAVNQKIAKERELQEGDEVALLPPFAGG